MEETVFNQFNEPILFEKITANSIIPATNGIISESRQALEKIYNIAKDARTFDNTMLVIDDIFDKLNNYAGLFELMANTHPDAEVRQQTLDCSTEIQKFENEIGIDEKLYQAIKDFAQTGDAKSLTGYKKIFTTKTLLEFERNGFALSSEERQALKEIKDKLTDLSAQYETNIADCDDFIIVSEQDMDGLPDDYKQSRKTDDGNYKIDMSYPSVRPFLRYAKSDATRKELFMAFQNRAKEKNFPALKEILILRKQLVDLLGYKTYAAYAIEPRMAKITETVWKFENDLIENIKPKIKNDLDELLDAKCKHTNNLNESEIYSWETSFYNNILLNEKYNLDDKKVKEYFEMYNVIDGLFSIYKTLFNIDFEELKNTNVWHPEVRQFEITKNNKLVGRFYLDLYPRPNKYHHAASFGIFSGKAIDGGYKIPTNCLVCNFPKPTANMPSLLPHSEVETFFHEFGHLLHSLLTKAALSSQSGTSVATDFVETPSQLSENWAWNYKTLKLFAKHYKTGEILPKELFEKMLQTKNVGSGIFTAGQIMYGVYDMTLHDKFDPNGTKTTTDVYKEIQNNILPYKFVDGTTPEASFGHLTGYAAGYYSYLWALVYAEDIFSVFEQNGLLNPQIGEKYLNDILINGSSVDELEQVKNFLGREPNQKAFLKSLGL